jgi:S1-C subfamily serine protease
MPRREVPLKIKLLLLLLFLAGFSLNVLTFLDAGWFHYLLGRRSELMVADEPSQEHLKPSILKVRVPACKGHLIGSGTGFVVKTGYVATAAHIVADHQACNAEIDVVDFTGRKHSAKLAGYSAEKDLALLSIEDTSLSPLALADSAAYETSRGVIRLFTIGYPLDGTTPTVSSEGTLSHYENSHDVFITSGLDHSPANTGSPVFVADTLQVLGIAQSKADSTGAEGNVTPIDTFKAFFRATTSQDL